MPTTRAQTAPDPWALFEACLHGNVSMVARLLEGPGAGTLQRQGPEGLTLLHAAVFGGGAAALPLLVADGAPLDAEVNLCKPNHFRQVADFLKPFGCRLHDDQQDLVPTALALAVGVQDGAAIEQLLQLGANPLAGSRDFDGSAWHALREFHPASPEVFGDVVGPFLRRGFDPLAPGPSKIAYPDSLLHECVSADMRRQLLQHLERLHAVGPLRLHTKQAAQLVRGAAACGAHPLVVCGVTALERRFGAAAGGGFPAAETPAAAPAVSAFKVALLMRIMLCLVGLPDSAPLAALLASRLPRNLHVQLPRWHYPSDSRLWVPLLAHAALSRTAHPDNCRLLHQAGAPLTADALYACIDELSAAGVSKLLACGTLAPDTSQPANTPEQPLSCMVAYSCPIHRTLHAYTQLRSFWGRGEPFAREFEAAAIGTLDALLAAGFRPCTWQHSLMPAFLQPSNMWHLLPLLDPFDLYSRQRSAALGLPRARCYNSAVEPSERMLFVARGGSCSPATRQHWPDSYKAAVRAFLLTAHASAVSRCAVPGGTLTRAQQRRWRHAAATAADVDRRQGCCLGDLPPELLQRIAHLAASPMSSWLQLKPMFELDRFA